MTRPLSEDLGDRVIDAVENKTSRWAVSERRQAMACLRQSGQNAQNTIIVHHIFHSVRRAKFSLIIDS